MSFSTLLMLVAGLLVVTSVFLLFSSFAIRRLHTVPVPPDLEAETLNLFPAETQAAIRLHRACFRNDARAANEALTQWAWAHGDSGVANGLDRKIDALREPQLREAVQELWFHLEQPGGKHWFGDRLWNGFLGSHPEFEEVELSV